MPDRTPEHRRPAARNTVGFLGSYEPVRSARAARVTLGLAAAVATSIGVTACDTSPPQVRIDDTIVEQTTDTHARLLVRMRVHNPNDDSVSLEEIRYRVGPFAGLRHPGISLPPNVDTTIEIPAVVPIDQLGARMQASGRVSWVPIGVISRSLHDTRVVRRTSSFGGAVEVE